MKTMYLCAPQVLYLQWLLNVDPHDKQLKSIIYKRDCISGVGFKGLAWKQNKYIIFKAIQTLLEILTRLLFSDL